MSSGFNEKNYSSKMSKSIQSLKKDISTLRTGRANPNMLDMIKVEVYGQSMPIEQLATVSVPEARLISIQVWDKANITLIDSALQMIDQSRSSMGALNNRLESTVDNLNNITVKTEASLARIMDADFAQETTELSKSQVLSQAATAMLAQANQQPQNVLRLLQAG